MKIDIPSFSENLDINPSWVEFMRWISSLTWLVLMEKQVKFVAYKIKGGATAW